MLWHSLNGFIFNLPPQSWPQGFKRWRHFWQSRQTHRRARDAFRQLVATRQFSRDWFSRHIPVWLTLLPHTTQAQILEIGSYEGLSTLFMLQHIKPARLDCVDTFIGSHEERGHWLTDMQARFKHNVAEHLPQVNILAGSSRVIVPQLQKPKSNAAEGSHSPDGNDIAAAEGGYDIIYIDGYHHSHFVLADALNSWPLLRHGGLMIFDDYGWNYPDYRAHEQPKAAIDAFLQLIKGEYILLYRGYQLFLQRQ